VDNHWQHLWKKELPKALEAIRKLDPTLSTLSSALNIKNVPERKTHFGKQLAKLCGEDAGTMSKWISMMETSAMCGNVGADVSKAIESTFKNNVDNGACSILNDQMMQCGCSMDNVLQSLRTDNTNAINLFFER